MESTRSHVVAICFPTQKVFLRFYLTFSFRLLLVLISRDMLRGEQRNAFSRSQSQNCISNSHKIRDFPSGHANEVFAALNSCHTLLHIFSVVFVDWSRRKRAEEKIFQTLSDREFIVCCVSCTRALHCLTIEFWCCSNTIKADIPNSEPCRPISRWESEVLSSFGWYVSLFPSYLASSRNSTLKMWNSCADERSFLKNILFV